MTNQALTIQSTAIRQAESGLFCLNDLHKASGGSSNHKPAEWLRQQSTADLIDELKVEYPTIELVETIKGRYGGTFAVKEIIYAYAMWISPAFSIRVIRAFDAVARGDEKQALALAGTQAAADRLALLDDELVKQYIGIRKRELRQLEQKANEIRESLGEMDLDAPDTLSQQIEAVIKTIGRRKEAGRTRLSVAELKDGVKNLKVFAGQSRLSTFITSKIMPEVGILGVATFDGKMIWIH